MGTVEERAAHWEGMTDEQIIGTISPPIPDIGVPAPGRLAAAFRFLPGAYSGRAATRRPPMVVLLPTLVPTSKISALSPTPKRVDRAQRGESVSRGRLLDARRGDGSARPRPRRPESPQAHDGSDPREIVC
jgi:hypothetical protein